MRLGEYGAPHRVRVQDRAGLTLLRNRHMQQSFSGGATGAGVGTAVVVVRRKLPVGIHDDDVGGAERPLVTPARRDGEGGADPGSRRY